MFVGSEIREFQARRISHLQERFKYCFWASVKLIALSDAVGMPEFVIELLTLAGAVAFGLSSDR